MFQLLKKFLLPLFFYSSCVKVGCEDVLFVNGTAGQSLTVTFTMKSKIEPNIKNVNIYQDNTKIYSLNIFTLCSSHVNHTLPIICTDNMSQNKLNLTFPQLIHSGVYYLSVLKPANFIEESNKVNLTVYPAEYTTTYNTVTAASFNNTSFQLDPPVKKSSMLVLVPVLVVAMLLVIILLSLLYWSCTRKTDQSPAVNSTSAPQVIPDVTSVEYCVLDFPNRAGGKVRSTEEPVEYSPIVFPSRKTSAQDNEIKSMTQQNKIKQTTLQCAEKETDKASEKTKTSKPKNQKCPNKAQV